MSEHWRLGTVEHVTLEALDGAGARADRPHRKSATIVQRMATDFGVGPRYGYDSICTLARPWLLHLPLVDFHGNNGSEFGDRAANPRYTEVRLSRAGETTLAAERGDAPRVPATLINGNLHFDGDAPPFSPRRVVAALLALIDDIELADHDLVELVGPPASPTRCNITCDYLVLATGAPTEMMLSTRMTIEDGPSGRQIVLTDFPLGTSVEAIEEAIDQRAHIRRRRPWQDHDDDLLGDLALPIRSLTNTSDNTTSRLVCEPRRPEEIMQVTHALAAAWGVTTRQPVQLPAPLPHLLRELVEEHRTDQRSALATLLG